MNNYWFYINTSFLLTFSVLFIMALAVILQKRYIMKDRFDKITVKPSARPNFKGL